jgi:hypothetical protein
MGRPSFRATPPRHSGAAAPGQLIPRQRRLSADMVDNCRVREGWRHPSLQSWIGRSGGTGQPALFPEATRLLVPTRFALSRSNQEPSRRWRRRWATSSRTARSATSDLRPAGSSAHRGCLSICAVGTAGAGGIVDPRALQTTGVPADNRSEGNAHGDTDTDRTHRDGTTGRTWAAPLRTLRPDSGARALVWRRGCLVALPRLVGMPAVGAVSPAAGCRCYATAGHA